MSYAGVPQLVLNKMSHMHKVLCVIGVAVLSIGLSPTSADESLCPSSSEGGRYDYKQVLCLSILFYDAQRSGVLPPNQRFTWRGDSGLQDGADNGVDLTGGYYDAGDHVKFNLPMAFTLTMLSWGVVDHSEAYEQAGQLEYARTAIRWGTDYFLKCHSENMTLYAQVGDAELDHLYWGRPEDMTMERPSLKIDVDGPGSDLAGEASAALAAASIVFSDSDPEYSAELLAASRDLFVFADEYRATYHESLPEIGNYYVSPDYGDELCWAAVWLYRATGEQQYRDKAYDFWVEFDMGLPPSFFDWGTVNAGVQVLYAHEFDDPQYISAAEEFMIRMRNTTHTPGGLVYLTQWGCLRHAVNVAFVAIKAAELAIEPTINRAWAEQQAHYVLGSSGRSYVIGYGVDYPERPHHRASSCPDAPEPCDSGWALNQSGPNPQVLYGALVGGPDINDNHSDDRSDYVHNEVSLNYNSGLACLMAAMASQ